MKNDILRYDRMVERALRTVVRDALIEAAERGLPDDHHFYISFATHHPGVDIPDYLRSQYPQEMTIVIQYQFFGLTVDRDQFSVTLSFNNAKERLTVPLAAVTTFADPAVNFALQFQPTSLDDEAEGGKLQPAGPGGRLGVVSEPVQTEVDTGEAAKPDTSEKVVTLDRFRKKQDSPSG